MANLGIIRLSEVKGDAQTGPVRQRADIIQRFAAIGVSKDEILWAEDLDISAFHIPPMRRPSLRRALDALEPGSTIVFWKLDRFVRRVFPDFSDMLTYTAERKHKLVSSKEDLDLSGAMGLMQATLLAFLGQMESENTSMRVSSTNRYLRKVGRWKGGRLPAGYAPVRIEGKPGVYLQEDAESARTIREVVDLALGGRATNHLTFWLNQQGVPTTLDRARVLQGRPRFCECGHDEHAEPCEKIHKCRHRMRDGNGKSKKLHEYDECSVPCPMYEQRKWSSESVYAMLRSPSLCGYTVEGGKVLLDDNGKPVSFAEGIITPETFQQLQEKLDARATKKTRTQTDSLLLGIAACDCGAPLYRGINKNRRGEWTYDYYRHATGTPCNATMIPAARLDDLVTQELLTTLGDREVLARRPPSVRLSELKAELSVVNAQLVRLFREQLEGPVQDNHAQLTADLNRQRDDLRAALDSEETPGEVLVPTGQLFKDKWESLGTTLERRLWLLDAGVRVDAVRGRMPALKFRSLPRLKRSLRVAAEGDLNVVIYLGNLGEILRRAGQA